MKLLAGPCVAAFMALALPGSPAALACGYHDPSSVNRGMLNISYPDALHVHTAVWMAQLEGVIPRSEQPADGNEQPDAIKALVAYRDTLGRLGVLRDRMSAALQGRTAPAFSMVLIGPMLWVRFEQTGATLDMAAHASSPSNGDVVIVTDEPVVAALVDGRISLQEAREHGLIRFYGEQGSTRDVAFLLDRLSPPENPKMTSTAYQKGTPP